MKISMFIPIIPVAQKRSRSRAVKMKTATGKDFYTSMNYKDPAQEKEEDNFRALLYRYKPPALMAGPIVLTITAVMPIPPSKSQKWKMQAQAKIIKHTKRPDLDNLVKHVKDCMKGVFYLDDKQIFELRAFKYYGGAPGWNIVIEGVEECA